MNSKSKNKALAADQCIALLFPNFAMSTNSILLQNISEHLKKHQLNSYVVPNHIVQDNTVDFRKMETDENFMNRLVTAVTEILSGIEPQNRKHVFLIGFSGGARFMVAYALAKQLGLAPDVGSFDIPGLIAFNIYTRLRNSKPTTTKVEELHQINHMELRSNIERLKDILVYDVYNDLDTTAADMAGTRKQRFERAGLKFKQHCIESRDITKDEYYEKHYGEYHLYTENSAHNWKNFFLKNSDETYECVHRLHGADDAPVETIIDQFLIDAGFSQVQ